MTTAKPASTAYVATIGVDDWLTPDWLFSDLDARYRFTLDAAASAESAKCERWLGPGSPSLEDARKAWPVFQKRVWLNPPYGKLAPLLLKQAAEAVRHERADIVVAIVPPRHNTRWWIEQIVDAPSELRPCEILEPDMRIQFDRPPACVAAEESGERIDGRLACGHKQHSSNTTPSVLPIWRRCCVPHPTKHTVYPARAIRAEALGRS